MAIRKVVWRALLEGMVGGDVQPKREKKKLGKLNDRVYKDWDTFVRVASEKMGLDIPKDRDRAEEEEWRLEMEGRLEVLHVLRCLLGPLVESLIILDRLQWIRDQLRVVDGRKEEMQVQICNIFDQGCGSPRNVALVISPPPPLAATSNTTA
jgi:hypothetical protein